MRPSRKHLFFAGAGLAALFLILFGEALTPASNSRGSSLAAFQPDSGERWAVSISPVASIEKDSNGRGEVEEQLRLLLEELKRLEKDAEEKFRKEILPYLKREIEKLRNRLKEFSPGKEETPPPRRIGI
jgi:hypothetical protein